MIQTRSQHILLRVLQGSRTAVLLRAALVITAIALIDWRFDVNISFGFLYLFPMIMVGNCLSPWQIAGVAAVCTGLVEAFDAFPWATQVGIPRLILTFAAFTGAGCYVYESARNRLLASIHLADVEREMELRREAEAQMKVLIESSPATIFTVDSEGRVLLANEAAHRLFGVTSGQLAGRGIGRYLPALTRIPFPRAESRLFRTAMECRGKREDGSVFLAQVWFSTYATSSGARLAALVFDSSDELRDREEFSLQHLMAGSRIAVSAVCHEIRNVCGAIAAVHAKLARSGAVAKEPDFVTLGTLLEGLVRIAGLEMRESKADAEYVEAGPILEELRIVIEPGFQEAGLAIEWHIEENLPAVWASRQELLQAFLNITQNSRRAMALQGEGKLVVGAFRKAEGVLVRFLDSGSGVAAPEQLFKPFQPGAQANGLGLYLSRAFVRSFRGELSYEPTAAGACFVVWLEAAPDERDENRQSSQKEQSVQNPVIAG